jgi:hypothetical protein
MLGARRTAERLQLLVVGCRVGVFAIDVPQPRGELRESRLVDHAVLHQALASAG